MHFDPTIRIGNNVKIGKNVAIGPYTMIWDDVTIEDNSTIGSFCVIKRHTYISSSVFFDDFCISSGKCFIGEGSQIRYQSIIARNVVIGRNVFFCAGVKTAYLDHAGLPSKDVMRIGDEVFVGDNSTILAGKQIAKGVVIGAHSLVTKNLDNVDGVYMGCPAKFVRSLGTSEISRRERRISTR